MLQTRLSPLLSVFFRVSGGAVGNTFAVPRYVIFYLCNFLLSVVSMGRMRFGCFVGRSESRSGYFGESWGDYLIDLSIFGDFGRLDLLNLFLFLYGYLVCLFQAICGWCFGVVWLQGVCVCGFASRSTRTHRAGFMPLST
jgi:hypothetical protein